MRHSAYQCAPPGGSASGPRGATPSSRRSGSRTSKSGRRSSSSTPRPWKSTNRPSGSAAAGRMRCASSGVAADLPVRDGDAAGADQHHAGDPEQADPSVSRVPAPKAGEDERAEDPADETADVPAPRDPAEGEAEDQVDDDQAEGLAADDLAGGEVLEHEQGAEEAENRPRGAHRRDERRLEERARRA